MPKKTILEAIGAVALLAVFALLSWTGASRRSVTAPEVVHLPAGRAYAASGGDARFLALAPPLTGGLAGLVAGAAPDGDSAALLRAPDAARAAVAGPAVSDATRFGRAWFARLGAPFHDMMARARVPGIALGVVLGLFIFLVARALFGGAAGLLALALYASAPDFLGWAGLVAPAVPAAALAFGALYALLRFARSGRWLLPVAAGVALGTAVAADFAALFFLPVFGVTLALAGGPTARPDGPARPWWRSHLVPAVLLIAVALGVATLLTAGHLGAVVRGATKAWAGADPEESPVYLTGAWQAGGFLRYFLVILAVKTPVATLVLVAAGTAAVLLGRAGRLSRPRFLLLVGPVAGCLALAALAGRDTCRSFLFPALAGLFVLGGGLLAHPRFRTWIPRTVVAGLVALAWISAWTGRSHYLAYFNSVSGGVRGGPELVSDSCIDVGQDLGALARWCEEHGVESVGVIPGAAALEPEAYGIPARVVSADEVVVPGDGWYAVGAAALHARGLSAVAPVALDWFEEFKPVAVPGGSIYVYRFRPTSAARPDVPEGFQGEVLPEEAMVRRRMEQLESLHAAAPANGWVAGRLGELMALGDRPRRALELLDTARADERSELHPDRVRWTVVAAWQNAALGRLDRAIRILEPWAGDREPAAGASWAAWAWSTRRYLEEVRHALRETRSDPPRQEQALARVRRLAGRVRRALEAYRAGGAVPAPLAAERPDRWQARAELAEFCRRRGVGSVGVLPHDPDGRFGDAGVPARPMQPEEVLEPVGVYAIHERALGRADNWAGCGVVLDWGRRFQPVVRIGPWRIFAFVTRHERRPAPPPGFAGTVRSLEQVARDAEAILQASLERSSRDPWCRAERALRRQDARGLVDALGDHPMLDLRYRLRWLAAAALIVLNRGDLDTANRLLGEIRVRRKIQHAWLDHVQNDLNALRQELARGLSTRDPGPLNRVRRITAQLQMSLNLVFSLPERAHRLYEQGRAEEAAALNNYAVSRAPNPDWLFDAGILAFRGWQVDQAVRYLEQAEQGGAPLAALFLARALAFRGVLRDRPSDLEQARAAYDRARAAKLDVGESFEKLVEPYREIATDLRRAMLLEPAAGAGAGEKGERGR